MNKKIIILGSTLLLVAGIGIASAADVFSGNGNRGESRLNSLVEDGKITEEQKTAIEQKREEFRNEAEKNREEHRAEMKEWMNEQGIDSSLFQQNGPKAGKGMQNGGGQGKRNFIDANGNGTCDHKE